MRSPRLRSPLARAVVPVLAGIAFFVFFFAGLWLAATVINDRADPGSKIANKVFEVGKVKDIAKAVSEGGPLLFPDLKSADGIRSIVLDHQGTDPATGWQVYYAYPADRDSTCLVTHIAKTDTYTDCDNRTVKVTDLALPTDVRPVVENRTTLSIDLRGITSATTVPTTTTRP
ncbi:MAG: hypothetical protein RJA47_893 [Actinomycetota bacterium]